MPLRYALGWLHGNAVLAKRRNARDKPTPSPSRKREGRETWRFIAWSQAGVHRRTHRRLFPPLLVLGARFPQTEA
ncbi:hypothetical protein, partial [Novosphingobium sp. 11B]